MNSFTSSKASALRVLMALAVASLLTILSVPVAHGYAKPIPGESLGIPYLSFDGSPATAQRVESTLPPRHPFMASNGNSNIHGDAWQSDSYATPGPLGKSMRVRSNLQIAECAGVTFDSRNRLVTICVGITGPKIVMMNADSLNDLATYTLPGRQLGGGDLFSIFSDFSGGGYFYLDSQDRVVTPTNDHHIQVIGLRDSKYPILGFKRDADYDLTGAMSADDAIISALPDWSGRIWFITRLGIIGTVNPSNGAIQTLNTGEGIGNSFAVDEDGAVYVATNAALYRLDANATTGTPEVTWREGYANVGVQKPGQTQAGSGTTPTVMRNGLVAITDNADPMAIVVMRRAAAPSGGRVVCTKPVFGAGASSTDQSLIAAGDSLIVENNYGYTGLASTLLGQTTTPGLQKIKVDAATGDCTTVWTSGEVSPSAVAKLSLSTGLVYTYTKPARGDGLNAWYFAAINACTGQTVYRRVVGTGPQFNNNFAAITLSADGDAYVGVLGGITRITDYMRPTGASPSASPAC